MAVAHALTRNVDLRGVDEGDEFSFTGTLVMQQCCNCSTWFAMPKDLEQRATEDHSISFYCPLGHGQHYTGPTPEQRAKQEAARERNRADQLQFERDVERNRADHNEARARGYKGAMVKQKKRALAAVCPCCNRHFQNVRRHIESQHPDQLAAFEESSSDQISSEPVAAASVAGDGH